MFGLSDKGFKRKTYTDIILDLETRAKELFGENINLTERSPLGLFLRIIAWATSILWQLAEKIYYSAYVDDAEGIQLDKVAKNIGRTRRGAKAAIGKVLVIGDEGTVISRENLTIGTKDNIRFIPSETIIIDSSGEIEVPIIAVEAGASGNVPANTITEIITPIAGLQSVTNPQPTKEGRNAEIDKEFRERYYISIARAGASTIDSITASLLDVEDVRTALVIENTTNEVDAEGRPPKSIQCYVLGGTKKQVAEAIFSTKPAGIETYGYEVETVTDLSGRVHYIRFGYAEVIPIFINISLIRNSKYRPDGDKLIKSEIIKYIGGYDYDGQLYNGLNIEQDVIFTRLVTAISKVDGVDDFTLTIGLSLDELQSSNIKIPPVKVAETSLDRIVISYV